jgi:hypothetical protein
LVIIELVVDREGDGHRSALRRYELGLFTRTRTGGVHDLVPLGDWCRAAGFDRHEVHRFDGDLPLILLVARSPSEPS